MQRPSNAAVTWSMVRPQCTGGFPPTVVVKGSQASARTDLQRLWGVSKGTHALHAAQLPSCIQWFQCRHATGRGCLLLTAEACVQRQPTTPLIVHTPSPCQVTITGGAPMTVAAGSLPGYEALLAANNYPDYGIFNCKEENIRPALNDCWLEGSLQQLGDTCDRIPECVALSIKPGKLAGYFSMMHCAAWSGSWLRHCCIT